VNQALALGEDGQLVDVVGIDDVTPVESTGALVVLGVPGVADVVEVIAGEVDFVRVGVIELAAEAPAVLDAETNLEAVVVSVGGVLLLVDVGVALVGAELVEAAREVRNARDCSAEAGSAVGVIGAATVVVARVAREATNRNRDCLSTGVGGDVGDVDGNVVDVVFDVLVPRQVADVLHNHDNGGRELMLYAEAELGDGGSLVILLEVGDAGGEDREALDALSGGPVEARLAEGVVADAQVIGEGRVGGGVVDVVALHALVEGSEAAAENGFAVAEHVFREANARLDGVVVVLDEAAREAFWAARPMPFR